MESQDLGDHLGPTCSVAPLLVKLASSTSWGCCWNFYHLSHTPDTHALERMGVLPPRNLLILALADSLITVPVGHFLPRGDLPKPSPPSCSPHGPPVLDNRCLPGHWQIEGTGGCIPSVTHALLHLSLCLACRRISELPSPPSPFHLLLLPPPHTPFLGLVTEGQPSQLLWLLGIAVLTRPLSALGPAAG